MSDKYKELVAVSPEDRDYTCPICLGGKMENETECAFCREGPRESEPTGFTEYYACPFCDEKDFDAYGLKMHFLRDWCDAAKLLTEESPHVRR